MEKDKYDLEDPYPHKQWMVFPQAVFGQINYTTCGDSGGKCLENITLERCLNESEGMMGGYYIQGVDRTLCVPVPKDTLRDYQPYHAIRPSRLYEPLKNLYTYAFVNKDMYAFPPEDAGLLTYRDNFYLKNVQSEKTLSFEDENDLQKFVFYKLSSSELEIIPLDIPIPYINYRIPVKNHSKIIITIPNSSMLLRVKNNKLEWAIRVAVVNDPSNSFEIHTDTDSEYISFSDKVYFTLGEKYLAYDNETSTLYMSTNPDNKLFLLVPKRTVYYADATTCKSVPLHQTEIKGSKAYYDGHIAYRRSTCWLSKRPDSYAPYYALVFFSIFIIFLFWKLVTKQRTKTKI